MLALSRFGKGSAAYSRIDVVSIAGLLAIGVAQRRRRVLEGARLRLADGSAADRDRADALLGERGLRGGEARERDAVRASSCT